MRIPPLCAILCLTASASAAALDGVWELTITRFGEPMYRRATLQTSGDKITGKSDDVTIEGTVHGDAVTLGAEQFLSLVVDRRRKIW